MTDRATLLKALGVDLPEELLTMSLTHRSYSYENGGLPTNERLEFLGDAVLGLTITEELYHRHPDRNEGDLAKLRASIVNTHALAEVGRQLTSDGLGAYLLLGKGEENSGGAGKASILADGVESLLGAIYLEHGAAIAREVILRLFASLLDTAPTLGAGLDWKSSLQELTATRGMGAPSYSVTSTGPDHDKEFTAMVIIVGAEYGRGVGRTKKEAELKAAAAAWTALTAAPGEDA
ncbi:ribonuclease III [Mycobacterium neglectum]|uniref:ribonuclease III n=1 Tax=Mycobacterium neglectum TaxID=242737 RepID=UPI000BFEF582|nr:ribonuclease III [Mycobacterium neglectum]